jgi:hypothetical protein
MVGQLGGKAPVSTTTASGRAASGAALGGDAVVAPVDAVMRRRMRRPRY